MSYKVRGSQATNIWISGKHRVKPPTPQAHFDLRDCRVPLVGDTQGFDTVHVYWENESIKQLARECGARFDAAPHFDIFACHNDPASTHLVRGLLPALERPREANRLFIEHIAMGLLIHLASRYGGIRFDPAATGGGLAPWQERRAKEMLVAQLDGELSIEDLARECDLSRSHFARAFKKSTGQPPHRWLMARRLERAQELLATSSKSVGEIAVTCGFADQSHFTRVFMELHQLPPGQWRRTCAEG